MKAIQILRIEKNDGVGMFIGTDHSAYDVIPEACKRHFDFKSCCTGEYFPRPDEENLNLYKDGNRWYCGFMSIEQLNSIIYTDEIKKLLNVGYNVLLLTVTNYQKGKKQILFTRDSVIETRNLNSLF